MTETNRIEYKQELTPEVDIEKEVVAFLNYKEGGFIYIGVDRILRAYGEESFKFTDNFIRITFPIGMHDTAHVTAHVGEEGTQSGPRRDQEGTGSATGVNTNNGANSETDTNTDTAHVTAHVEKLISVIEGELNREALQELVQINHRQHFLKEYLKPSIEAGYIELTIPGKPKSINQKYRLTPKGLQFKEMIRRKKE